MKARALWPMLVVAACSAEPRSASYFQAHPDEAERVAQACRSGSRRGAECDHADAAIVALKRAARMERYKKAFE